MKQLLLKIQNYYQLIEMLLYQLYKIVKKIMYSYLLNLGSL